MRDDHPDGDPHGLKHDELLNMLAAQNIEYNFMRLNSSTDKMIDVFNSHLADANAQLIETVNLLSGAEGLMRSVTASVSRSASVSFSVSHHATDDHGRPKPKKDYTIVEEGDGSDAEAEDSEDGGEGESSGAPDWMSNVPEEATKVELAPPPTIDELVEDDECLDEPADPKRGRFRVAPNPFAEGGQRVAYRAWEEAGATPERQYVVIKEFKTKGMRVNNMENYIKNASTQVAAKMFGDEWNRIKPATARNLHFAEIAVVNFDRRTPPQLFTLEQTVDGSYIKFNNNSGAVENSQEMMGGG